MDMIERVARAMWVAMLTQADEIGMPVPEDTFDDLHPEDRVRQLRIARAALATLREPTEAMRQVGGRAHFPVSIDFADECWRVMVDAALADKP